MKSGLYIVTLNNEEAISVNAQDPRLADNAIRVTREHCKFGKAKNLDARRKSYIKTFGEDNVNFRPIALVEDIDSAEKAVLAALNQYRIRGSTGRRNEWLKGINPDRVLTIAFAELDDAGVVYQSLTQTPDGKSARAAANRSQETATPTKPRMEYVGLYRIGKTPRSLKSHNEVSWRKIEMLIRENGGKADFGQLAAAVTGHRHHGESASNPARFVVYCINNGWLERTD